jgi:hypothetical protein
MLTNKILTSTKTDVMTALVSQFTHVSFGSGSTTESPTDTDLADLLGTKARQEYVELSDSIIFSGYAGSGTLNGNVFREAGWKNAQTGSLTSRKVFTEAITKTTSVEVWVDTEIAISVTQTN